MLQNPEEDVRKAASLALATSSGEDILTRLKIMAMSRELSPTIRRSAIDTLGMMTQREAVAVLMEILNDPDPEISETALTMIEQMTAQDFYGDAVAALEWWDKVKRKSTAQWQRIQIERLIRQNRAREQRNRDLEQRLASAMQDSYYRATEAQRPALLSAYLTDNSAAVRKLGLTIIQSMLAEGKTLSDDTVAQTRDLMSTTEPEVRAAAIQTVATLRDASDAERFQNLLKTEHNRTVRRALVNGLGYVGTAENLPALLAIFKSADPTIIIETVTALGRLAERGILDAVTRKQVADELIADYQATPRENIPLRERLLWALSRLGDPHYAAMYVACLDPAEAGPVRLAAIRAIAVLVDPRSTKTNGNGAPASQGSDNPALTSQQMLDALLPLLGDASIDIRRAAVETLAQFASTESQLAALWVRLNPEQESEEDIRAAVWRGVTRILSTRPYRDIDAWLQRLPGAEKNRRRQTIDLLQAAATYHGANQATQGELGPIRARLGAEYAAANQIDEALSNYQGALSNLATTQPDAAPRVALELLRLVLLNNRYDGTLAAFFTNFGPVLNGAALWEGIRGEIEKRLNPEEIDQAIAMLTALQTYPPATMPAETLSAIAETLQRARQIRQEKEGISLAELLRKLRENPEDPRTVESIVSLGERAIPILRETLRAALQAEPPDAAWISKLHDLLRMVQPDWTGFAPDAPLEEKLNSLN